MKGQIITFNAERKPSMYGLPDVVGRVVGDVAAKRQGAEEYSLAMALSVLSIAVGNRVKTSCLSFENKTNIWSLIIGPSGKAKSASCEPLLRPIQAIDARLATEYEAEVAKVMAEAAASKGKKSELILPPTRQIVLNDSTREARISAIKSNPHGLMLYHPEWSQYICDLARYSSGRGEIYEMNSLWDNSPLKVNRKGEPMTTITDPHLVVFGGLQSDMLRTMFSNPGFLASGFLPRFLVYYPENFPPRDYHTMAPLDDAVQREWHDFVNRIYTSPVRFNATIEPDAEFIYKNFCNSTATLEEQVDGARAAVLAKLRVNVLRLAGLATVANVYDQQTENLGAIVTMREMSWAIDMCWYFYDSACRMIRDIGSAYVALTMGECVSRMFEIDPTINKSKFAEAIGKDRRQLHRWINGK